MGSCIGSCSHGGSGHFVSCYVGCGDGVCGWQGHFHLFIHSGYFYSASSSPLLLRGAPDYSIDSVLELTRQSIIGNCEWRTCPRSLRGSWSGVRTCDLLDARHWTYQRATMPHILVVVMLDVVMAGSFWWIFMVVDWWCSWWLWWWCIYDGGCSGFDDGDGEQGVFFLKKLHIIMHADLRS